MASIRSRQIRLGALVAAGFCAVFISACGSSGSGSSAGSSSSSTDSAAGVGGASNQQQLNALYQAAVKAGQTTVVVYDTHSAQYAQVYAAFHKRYPDITVTGDALSGPDLDAKIQAEETSGKHVADIVGTGLPSAAEYATNKWLTPYKPFTMNVTNQQYFVPSGLYEAVALNPVGIQYNTNLVSSNDVPKSWNDLLDSQWKGKIVVQDPGVAGASAGVLGQLIHAGTSGISFVKAFQAQDPKIEAEGPATATDVANGSEAIAAPQQYSYYLAVKNEGAPTAFVFPLTSDNDLIADYYGLLTGAPDPIAAKLFLSWSYTPEAIAAQDQAGLYSPQAGATPPAGLPPLSKVNLLNGVSASQATLYDSLEEQVYGIFKGE